MQSNKIKLAVTLATVLAVFLSYQLYFPSIQYFECNVGEYGREWRESESGKKEIERIFTSAEYVKVKRYLFGFKYTINDYTAEECQKIGDEVLLCGKNDDFIEMTMTNGQMSQIKSMYDKMKNNKRNWQCEKRERVIK